MSTDLVTKVSVPSLAMSEAELISVLGASIYPGAKIESIKLVISYCKARQLDPLQKPVHIVPMDVKTDRKNQDGKPVYEKRDVVMPGVGLYRTDAARTGLYAGKTEPEFGPAKELEWRDDEKTGKIAYPEWCRVTVRRVVSGHVVEFTAKELWLENYATAGKWTTAPNAMWKKRPYAQLAKCAEAQALRMAFPEAVGAQPTAEEMEGKSLDDDQAVEGAVISRAVEQPKAISGPEAPAAQPEPGTNADNGGAAHGKVELLSEGAKATLKSSLARKGRTEADLVAAGFSKIDELPFGRFQEAMEWVKKNPAIVAA